MSGPLPPAIGGMASVIAAFGQSDLSRATQLQLFDTGKKTREGRSLLEGVQARLRLMRDWNTLLQQHRPDIAHIHSCSGLTFFLDGLLAWRARQAGTRVILHIHGGLFDRFLDGLNPVLRLAARRIAARADLLIALSADWQQRLADRLPGSHIAVLPNGVAEPLGPAERDPLAPPTFVFLGLLSRLKGVSVLLDALGRSSGQWRVLLAGNEGESGFLQRLQGEIDQKGLGTRMRLLGPVTGPAKDQLLLQADGFVLPSLAEGLPMSLLEAMAARLPVVVTSVGAMPEVIEQGVDGLLVPPEDARALAMALDQLAASPQLRRSLGERAYIKYRANYSADAMARQTLALYAHLMGRTPAPELPGDQP